MNYSKGVFYSKEISDLSEKEIENELKDQKVIGVRRIGKDASSSSLYLVTFDNPRLPERIYIGYLSIPLRAYIPPPLLCYNCGLLGHHRTACSKDPVCRKCTNPLHEGECLEVKCCLCGERHLTSAKTCKVYANEFQIKKLMVTNNISYFEAKTIINKNKTISFASKAASKSEDSETLSKLVTLIEHLNKRMEVFEAILLKISTDSTACIKPVIRTESKKIVTSDNKNEESTKKGNGNSKISEEKTEKIEDDEEEGEEDDEEDSSSCSTGRQLTVNKRRKTDKGKKRRK